jgi:S-DNA-T family DNA segregation ATPase FtsK/SpoIIIE
MGAPRRRPSPEVDDSAFAPEDDLDLLPAPLRRAREALERAPTVPAEASPSRRAVGAPSAPVAPPRAVPGPPDAAKRAPHQFARGRELGALLYVAAAVFLALGLASYDERGGADWVGPVGGRCAQLAVTALGVVAWAVPVELALFAIPFLRARPSSLTPARMAGDVVLAATASALVHVGAAGRPVFGGHPAGGVIGELFGELLRSLFSTVGTFLVGLTTIALVLIARASFSFIAFANRAGETGVSAAEKAADTMKGVREAWQQARELERLDGAAPRIVAGGSSGADEHGAMHEDGLSSAIGLTSDRGSDAPPSGLMSASSGYEDSGVRPKAELRLREDGALPKEAHAIARQLAGVDPRDDDDDDGDAPNGARPRIVAQGPMALLLGDGSPAPPSAAAPIRNDVQPAIVLNVPAKAPKLARRKKGEVAASSGPTIAEPSPEAALQRAERVRVEEPADEADEAEEPAAPELDSDPAPEAALFTASPSPSPVETTPEVLDDEVEEVLDEEPSPVVDTTPDFVGDVGPEADLEADEPPAPKPLPTRRMARPKKIFRLPTSELLDPPPAEQVGVDREQLLRDAEALVTTLNTYKVQGEVREIHPGPVVTTFEFEPRIGTKVREVEGLANDLRLSLAKESVRIVAPIPGKNRIGFELPNMQRVPVNMRELIEDRRFLEAKGALPVVLGRDIVGAPFFADLAQMPHLLVAGATGAGKSVGLNVMLTSLLYRRTPEELRFIMVDPKVVELAPFDRIPHMLLPVVTDMKQALNALKWCVDEMERRYQCLAQAGVKNITSYNHWCERVKAGEVKNPMPRTVIATDHNNLPEEIVSKDPSYGEQQFPEKLPYLVVVVDEFADLMMSVGKGEVEPPIARLAQKARAAGIHVILATQRPSVDVITGMIKANFPTRIAFRVAQRVDSRTILDAQGAEYLLGKGDMLVSLNGGNGLKRIQCPFVSEDEVQHVTDFLRAQGEPTFDTSILESRDEDGDDEGEEEQLSPKDQELYERAVDLVREARKCSTSWLQRKMGLGYNKAARFVDRMERMNVVGPSVGAGKDREVLV